MKATIEINLKPFNVPNYVIADSKPKPRDDGFEEEKKYHLSDLDSGTLLKLCNDFKDSVFKKAGKQHPPEQGQQ